MKKLIAVFALVTMAMGSIVMPASAAYISLHPPHRIAATDQGSMLSLVIAACALAVAVMGCAIAKPALAKVRRRK